MPQSHIESAIGEVAISDQRHRSPYGWRTQVRRLLWSWCQATLFRFSPRPAFRWRRLLLRAFGAQIDATARVHRTVRVEQPWNLSLGANTAVGDAVILYALGRIEVGDRVTLSQYSHLCAGSHDYRVADMPLTRPVIVIADDAWIATDAFVGPGVRVGAGAILGARAVTMRDLDAWTIYTGNPAVALKPRPPLIRSSSDSRVDRQEPPR